MSLLARPHLLAEPLAVLTSAPPPQVILKTWKPKTTRLLAAMLTLNSEPVVEGFGDEVVLILAATLAYAMFICYQIYLSMLPDEAEPLSRGSAGTITNTAASPHPNAAEPKPESEQREAEPIISDNPEADPEDTTEVAIRLKYLDDVTVTVECPLSTKVGTFKSRFFSEDLQEGKIVRLICYGKLLSNDQRSLKQSGINAENNIIHVQISAPPVVPPETTYRETAPPPVSRFEASVASLAYLVLGGMLALFWEEMIEYMLVYALAL